MKIIKRIALLICIAVALLTVAACGKTAESQSSAAPVVSDNGSETSIVVSDSNPSADEIVVYFSMWIRIMSVEYNIKKG